MDLAVNDSTQLIASSLKIARTRRRAMSLRRTYESNQSFEFYIHVIVLGTGINEAT